LGDAHATGTMPMDALKCKNVSVLALQIDISALQKTKISSTSLKIFLDPDYTIGVGFSQQEENQNTQQTKVEEDFDAGKTTR
jgi:hypothetical protein